MIKRALTLIAKTFLITFTATLTLGVGFVASIVFLIALGAGFAAGQSNTPQTNVLDEYTYHYGGKEADTTFVSIPINGVIMGENQSVDEFFSAFVTEGVVYGYDVKKQLQDLAEEKEVAGVILEINSPGGTIFGTQAIVDGVAEYKQKTNKPVLAYVGTTAASGGYWVAASADEIIADHGTVLGSIGVITGPFKYYDGVISEDGGVLVGGVQTENGISTEYITAGKYKDIGNPYRQLTDEERVVLQDSVNNSYDTFSSFVSTKRGIAKETITDQIGALVYDNVQAKELKLSNDTGSRDQAYQRLGNIINTDDFKIIHRTGSDSFWSAFESTASRFVPEKQANTKCIFEHHTLLLAYYGDVSTLCR